MLLSQPWGPKALATAEGRGCAVVKGGPTSPRPQGEAAGVPGAPMSPTTPTPFPPSFLSSSRAGLHWALGPPSCWLTLLYWERCPLYPRLKVEKQPASSGVQSPGGSDLLVSPGAGTTLGWAGGRPGDGVCRRDWAPGHSAAPAPSCPPRGPIAHRKRHIVEKMGTRE